MIVEQNGRLYQKLLVGFFLFMMVCTIISRIYDSVTVPKVITASAKEKAVEKVVAGTGTVREKELYFCDIAGELKVESVAVSLGKKVAVGEELYRYSLEDLTEKLREKGMEFEKLQLELEKEGISGEIYDSVTQSELAAWELKLAQREFEEGQIEFEESRADYLGELERLKKEYYWKLELTEDELWAQQAQERESARNGVDSAEQSRDLAVTEARRKVEDLEEELQRLKEETRGEGETGESEEPGKGEETGESEKAEESGESEKAEESGESEKTEESGEMKDSSQELAQAEKELKRAREDLEGIQARWNRQVDDARDRLDYLNDQRDRIRSGQTSSQEALRESYEAAVKQQEEVWKSRQEELEALQKNVERAQWNAQTAAKNDEYTRLTNQQKARLSQLAKKGLELEIEEKRREMTDLETLIAAEGRVYAGYSGTVAVQELTEGKRTSGQERLGIAVGTMVFEGEFEKEEQFLAEGDSLQIAVPGTNRKMEAVVSGINLLAEETGTFQAELSELNIPLGTVTGYECRKQSDIYRQVIPIDGLRKDMKGYYCLIARPKSGILGEEFRAERVDVNLLYQGSTEAAVEGAIFESDKIIIRSNQMIMEGDRVRPVAEL